MHSLMLLCNGAGLMSEYNIQKPDVNTAHSITQPGAHLRTWPKTPVLIKLRITRDVTLNDFFCLSTHTGQLVDTDFRFI